MNWFTENLQYTISAHTSENIPYKGVDSNIPYNLPTAIIGAKGTGKSTMITVMLKAFGDMFKYIIYIYSEHVDTTLSQLYHGKLLRIPMNQSAAFLQKYLSLKTEFMSWCKLFQAGYDSDRSNKSLVKLYCDNVIDAYIRDHPNVSLWSTAVEYLKVHMQPFKIVINDTTYLLDGFDENQHDMLIVDDIGVANELFPPRAVMSPLYKYITISRHVLLCSIFAGQDIMQLPRYMRKEINTWLFGYGIDINDINETNIPSKKAKEIIQKYNEVEPYMFIGYNGVNNKIFET